MCTNRLAKSAAVMLLGIALAISQANIAAAAVFTLKLTPSTGTALVIDDNENDGGGDDDLNPAAGQLVFSGTVPGSVFGVNTVTGLRNPPVVGATDPGYEGMHLTSVNVAATGAGSLVIELSSDDFNGFGAGGLLYSPFTALLSGVGSTVRYEAFVGPANSVFANTGTSFDSGILGPGANAADGFDTLTTSLPALPAQYAQYMRVTVTFGNAGGLLSFDGSMETGGPGMDPPFAPEPTSMLVWGLGMGLVGAGGYWRRKRAAV